MKILCRWHDDSSPSMHVYQSNGKNIGYCFVCGALCNLDEINVELNLPKKYKEPTNVPEMIKYIESLPVAKIRGLDLHYNERGYYVVWPNGAFYKLRTTAGKSRYIGPAGIKPPLFVYHTSPANESHLVVVEGEINAITLHLATLGDYKICSPGSASELQRHINYYKQFDKITLCVDYDAPGVVFGCTLRDQLLSLGKHVRLMPLEKDFNDILVQDGEDAVREVFEKGLR